MTIRQDMLRAASQAKCLLNDSAELVINFIHRQMCQDGGFKSRSGQSDLYYTVFGIEILLALEAKLSPESISKYLRQFSAGDSLDLVHLSCLSRCLADIAQFRQKEIESDTRVLIAANLESYRSSDGGYSNSPTAGQGTVYGCFLALGAYQDLNIEMKDHGALADCVKSLQTKDGAYSNEQGRQVGSTPATAAALALQHYLDMPIDDCAAQWLLSQCDDKGGFLANPALRQVGLPDLLSTATALHALAVTKIPVDHIKEKCLDFLDSLWSSDGGFCGSWADRALDCEYTYYGLLALGNLSDTL